MIWIASLLLVGEYFGMYTEEVLIGSNSVGLFVWSRKCVLVRFGHRRAHAWWLHETDSFIAIPQWARWIVSSVLLCGYFSMYIEEVWIGFGSIGPFVLG